jgi:hypothetical protein
MAQGEEKGQRSGRTRMIQLSGPDVPESMEPENDRHHSRTGWFVGVAGYSWYSPLLVFHWLELFVTIDIARDMPVPQSEGLFSDEMRYNPEVLFFFKVTNNDITASRAVPVVTIPTGSDQIAPCSRSRSDAQ